MNTKIILVLVVVSSGLALSLLPTGSKYGFSEDVLIPPVITVFQNQDGEGCASDTNSFEDIRRSSLSSEHGMSIPNLVTNGFPFATYASSTVCGFQTKDISPIALIANIVASGIVVFTGWKFYSRRSENKKGSNRDER